MRGWTAVVVLVLIARCASAAFLTAEELEKGQCYSQVAGYVSKVSVQSVPVFPVDILDVPGTHRKFFISCMKATESGPVLAPSQIGLCSTPALLQICTAYSAAPTEWDCKPYPDYQRDPNTDVYLGATNDQEKHIKIQWVPQSTGVLCFPRDITFQFVGTAIVPEKSNTAANVAFIVIVCVVGVIVIIFASYQLRKVLRKFWKKEKSRPTTHLTELEQTNTLKALGGTGAVGPKGKQHPTMREGNNVEGVDLYDENVIYSGGQQAAIIDEGMTEVRAQPLPKPWYMRAQYDLSKVPKQDPEEVGGSPTSARAESIVRSPLGKANANGSQRQKPHSASTPTRNEQNSSYYVNMYDDSNDGFPRGSVRPQLYQGRPLSQYDVDTGRQVFPVPEGGPDDDEEDDIVLTCTDCLLPIRGTTTPQYCAVTGKRHY